MKVRLIWLAAMIIGATVCLAYLSRLYQVDESGVSPFVGKPPTLDFTNLWYGGRLALEGRTDVLFDVQAYRAGLEQIFAPGLQPSEWSYPPSLLLIAAPLALLPLYPAYILWTLGTLLCLSLVLWRAGVSLTWCALLWISPAVLTNIFFGHNGAATAALLIGGLLVAERKPWLAGVCFGLLTMKPQLGILIPVCLLAVGNLRAVLWSAIFAISIAAASAGIFPGSWSGFFMVTQPLMQSVLEAPYGNGYQMNAVTPFLTARWLGADLSAAYAIQAFVTAAAAWLAWAIWRSDRDRLQKVAATALLTPLATPYAYSYDLVVTAAAIVMLGWRPLCIPLWLLPGLVLAINQDVGHIAPAIIALALLSLRRSGRFSGQPLQLAPET